MKLVKYEDLLNKENIKNSIVLDLKTNLDAIVFSDKPLIIEFEDGRHRPREFSELLFYIWDENDINQVKKKAEKLQEFFNKD